MFEFDTPAPSYTGLYITIAFFTLMLIGVSVLFGGYIQLGWLRTQKFIDETCTDDASCGNENLYCSIDKKCTPGTTSTPTQDSCLAAGACGTLSNLPACINICNNNVTLEKCKAINKCPVCPTTTP